MLLEIKNLSKEYRRNGKSFYALNNVNFTVSNGQFISIVGCSGSGKSTLLSIIAGLLSPSGGDVIIDGQSVCGLSDSEISGIRSTKIGYIPQGQSLLPNLTVLDNVCLPHSFTKQNDSVKDRAINLLKQLGIEELADSYPGSLSGGERRRAVIARALINEPQFLLADEPTSDLDSENTEEVIRIFKSIAAKGTAVLMVTHDLPAANSSDSVYEICTGRFQAFDK